jgi:tight adherence protein C
MTSDAWLVMALVAGASGCVLLAVFALARGAQAKRGVQTLDHALGQRASRKAPATASPAAAAAARSAPMDRENANAHGNRRNGVLDAITRVAMRWVDSPFGAIVVAQEDRQLLERGGYVDPRARARFFMVRMACAALLPLFFAALRSDQPMDARAGAWLLAALTTGFLLPKWMVKRRAKARREAIASELPMFVDLLRLLQGVGLSLDQTLQVMISDFNTVMPMLAHELTLAHRQFTTGRSREQSLHRLASVYENDDLNAVVRLLVQVDRHGGAVQEPLRQFGDRLRETRRSTLRERIGTLTVKMTGVMVVTLLPALLIITAGPGFIAVLGSLGSLALLKH